jgi:hypothetical protein
MNTHAERLERNVNNFFQMIENGMNNLGINEDDYGELLEDKQNHRFTCQAPHKKGVKDLLIKKLIENDYEVKEELGCKFTKICNHMEKKPDCNTVCWLTITNRKLSTIDEWVMALFSKIEVLMTNEDTNDVRCPIPKNKNIKKKLIAKLRANHYKVTESTIAYKHFCDGLSCDSDRKYECPFTCNSYCDDMCNHVCLLNATNCSYKHWLVITHTIPELITKVADLILADIDRHMCEFDENISRYVPLKSGVKELLLQKLRAHDYEVTIRSENVACSEQDCHYVRCSVHKRQSTTIEVMDIRERQDM